MTDGEPYSTPEDAAAGGDAGETLEVAVSPDGRWAVVVRRGAGPLMFVLCEAVSGGWRFHDENEMTTSAEALERSVWISLVDEDVALNTGVKVTFGSAPAGATDEVFWLVRWNVTEDGSDEFTRGAQSLPT